MSAFPQISQLQMPKISIDPATVIKPCITNQTARESFIDKPMPSWKPFLCELKNEGLLSILRLLANLKLPPVANPYKFYCTKAIKLFATAILYLIQIYTSVYTYFYPYSQLSLDQLCDEFSRCHGWSTAVIRSFAWHPNYDRCALAICNDCIYVYEKTTKIRLLRHHHMRKIVDICWQPNNKEVLAVATQTKIILWHITEQHHDSVLSHSIKTQTSNIAPSLRLLSKARLNDTARSLANTLTSSQLNSTNNSTTHAQTESSNATAKPNFRILENLLEPPIVSLKFDGTGQTLCASSPNSSKLVLINVDSLLSSNETSKQNNSHVTYIRKYGQGMTRVVWSPTNNRLVVGTTSNYFRAFEPFGWSSSTWKTTGLVKDMAWSKPEGRILLLATKESKCLYGLPFFDNPTAGDVGGNKSIVNVLDFTERQAESGNLVGGRVQAMIWDKSGKRLAVSFRDNSDSIMLFKTQEKPTVEFTQIGLIQSDNGSIPLIMEFHDKFKNGSLLTICWSDGNCQHIPLTYSLHEPAAKPSTPNGRLNASASLYQGSPAEPRSLTSFCHVTRKNQNNSTMYTSTNNSFL